tara:strand:- start:154 stop:426 length:273 start_codon:yes stop_codon:yes gene_type:complete
VLDLKLLTAHFSGTLSGMTSFVEGCWYLLDYLKKNTMFGLFKKKSEIEKLQEQYQKLMKEYHDLSTSDRTASDKAYAAADVIAKKMDALN